MSSREAGGLPMYDELKHHAEAFLEALWLPIDLIFGWLFAVIEYPPQSAH